MRYRQWSEEGGNNQNFHLGYDLRIILVIVSYILSSSLTQCVENARGRGKREADVISIHQMRTEMDQSDFREQFASWATPC